MVWHGVCAVCDLRIKEVTPFSLEKEMHLYLRGGGVDVDRCISFTHQFESVDPCNHRDRIQVVRIGALEVYRLLFSIALLSCKVVLDEENDKAA